MDETSGTTTIIGLLLDQLRKGDRAASDRLLSLTYGRLKLLARIMLRNYPIVGRWEQADDILQNAVLKLHRALKEVTPESPLSFFQLAAVQMRRVLIDLARHYSGPHNMAALHESVWPSEFHGGYPVENPATESHEPSRLEDWTKFHEQVDALPDEPKEVFILLWYHGLTQAEVGELLGITERVVNWRWRAARIALHKAMGGQPPG